MAANDEMSVNDQIAVWREFVTRRPAMRDTDAAELEDHLRSQIDEFTDAGLSGDEAFLVAVKRMGSVDELSREFAREHSDRLWKQLVLTGEPGTGERRRSRYDLLAMIVCAVAAALAVKVPALFGLDLVDDGESFYFRNASLFAFVPLAAYFIWHRRIRLPMVGVIAALFGAGIAAANMYPLADDSHTSVLTGLHLPIAMWLVVAVAYTGGDWRSDAKRMDFIRFTGEAFIYYVLIALGGGVLTAITFGTFEAIGLDVSTFIGEWMIPCGAAGAVVVAAWLVEAKKSVIENMAPVLTRVFTPLFVAVLLAFLGAVVWTTSGIVVDRDDVLIFNIGVDRDVLLIFNVMLIVVLGLLLYAISARESSTPPGFFDWQQLALVGAALLIDALVLIDVLGRISEWGVSPNRVAVLGENVVLLVNLAVSAWLLWTFLRRRGQITKLDRWQTGYLAVYAAWAWFVVLALPPLFDFA